MGSAACAHGHAASQCSSVDRPCTHHAAACHSGAQSTPASASGVTTSVVHGMATTLAAKPTSDTCPNSSSVSGVIANVITHCSRSMERNRAPALIPRALPAIGSVANSTATATKLSQKPGCSSAHGSSARTTAQASSHTCGHGQRRPDRRKSATTASMHTVRCAGTPQPLKSA
jgi:hypothetical protein